MKKRILKEGIVEEIINNSDVIFKEVTSEEFDVQYPSFIKYFENRDVLNYDDLVIGASFTYAWMPTILHFKSDLFDESVQILNKAKKGDDLTIDEIMILKGVVNNSLVGASKLLHFINPNKFAIWDSRVLTFLDGKGSKWSLERPELFEVYLKLCNQVVHHPNFKSIHEKYDADRGYPSSPMRVAELIMFHSGKQGHTTKWLK